MLLTMKKMRLCILIVLIFGCFISKALAQTDNKLACVTLVKKDSIMLRWVPASIPVWQIGVKYGYIIKRYTIAKGGVFIPDGLSKGEMLTTQPIRPATNDAFDIIALSEPRAAVVQEAIYGTDFQPPAEGTNFTGFMKAYKDLEVRFGFAMFMCDLSPAIARAAGLQFTDRNILPDERYAYSISPANVPDGMQVEPAVIVLDAGLITKLPPVTDVQAIFLDKMVKFQWPVMLHKGTYTAYILEKSADGVSFSPVSDLPLVNLSEDENLNYFAYTDSLSNNNEQTWYRVKGISPFGEEGPASDIIKGKGIPEFTAYAVIDTSEVIENKSIIIRWRVTESESAPVTGISILRSDKYDGVFENLSSKPMASDVRMFTDTRPLLSNYYKIMLLGKNSLTSYSFPYLVQTEDNDPPAPPQMLTGNVDSAGIVTIAWKENTEPDLMGYKVFRANAPDEEFIALGRDITLKNICRDTINLHTLTQKIYFQVVAIDKRYNSSDYSAILELSRPDTIRPAPAIITRIVVQNGKVTIQLEGSPASDINFYELYRIAEKDTSSIKLITWKGNLPAAYEDIPSGQGNYFYLIKTFDLAGNSSEYGRMVYLSSTSQKTVNLKATQGKSGKSIILTWDMPADFKPTKTIVYRSKETDPISIYTTLEGSDQLFEDKEIEINTIYNYRIKVFSTNSSAVITSRNITFTPLSNSVSEVKQN